MPTLLEPGAISREERLAREIAALKKRVSDLERTQGAIPQIVGAPTSASADGSQAADTTGPYYWLRVGGVWRRTAALT